MKKNIYALSYNNFKEVIHDREITDDNVKEHATAFIQILNTDNREEFVLNSNDDNVLALRFDDVDEPLEIELINDGNYVQVHPMSEEQAKLIVDFIKHNTNKKTFIVHCSAGVSRSGGVSQFLAEYFDIPLSEYRINNPYVHPNKRIIRLLRTHSSLDFLTQQAQELKLGYE